MQFRLNIVLMRFKTRQYFTTVVCRGLHDCWHMECYCLDL